MRIEFTLQAQQVLAERAGLRCSRYGCDRPTSGPRSALDKSINVGVAAHITAASPGGPRYDPSLTPEERRSPANGIWLCQTCAKLVDNDAARYPVDVLREWKTQAEQRTLARLEAGHSDFSAGKPFAYLESLIPEFLAEMAADLSANPLVREFACLKKRWAYSGKEDEFVYYYEDHPRLDSIARILQNYGLIYDITTRNVDRFAITEQLACYLTYRSG